MTAMSLLEVLQPMSSLDGSCCSELLMGGLGVRNCSVRITANACFVTNSTTKMFPSYGFS